MSGARRWLLKLLVTIGAASAMLISAPAAFGAFGSISGTVTRASDSAGVVNVEVDV